MTTLPIIQFFKLYATQFRLVLVSALLSLTALTLFHFPIKKMPLYGDDFLLVRDSLSPGDYSSVDQLFWLTGAGKWRPISTVPLVLMGRMFGYQIAPFMIVNLVLLVFVALMAAKITLQITKNRNSFYGMLIITIVSEFTWLSLTSVYGVMELLSLLFLLIGISLLVKTGLNDFTDVRLIPLSAFFILLASLSHERFLIVAFPIWLSLLVFAKDSRTRLAAHTFLLVPSIRIFVSGFILNIDFLTGGGESQIRTNSDTWILVHLLDSFKMMLGFQSGTGKFYGDSTLENIARANDLGLIALAFYIPLVLYLILRPRQFRAVLQHCQVGSMKFLITLLLTSCVSLAIISSTVLERTEGRWIFGPFLLFAICTFAMLASSTEVSSSSGINLRTVLLIFALLMPSLVYRKDHTDFTLLRDQVVNSITQLESHEGTEEHWGLIISQSDLTMPVNWQFAYGKAFNQLANPPDFIDFVSGDSPCPILRISYVCINLVLSNQPNPIIKVLDSPPHTDDHLRQPRTK